LIGNLHQLGLPAVWRNLALPGLRRFTLRIRLCLLVAIILAPALIVAGMLAMRSTAIERNHVEEDLGRSLSQLSVEIDREVQNITGLLVTLAVSRSLQNDDLEAFRQRATDISSTLGIQVAVHRLDLDKRIVISGLPRGETLESAAMPAVRLEAEQQAIHSGGVAISDVFFAPVSKQFLVSAIMPVMRNGIAEYAVSVGIPIKRFSNILENASPGADHVAVVVDRSNTIVARSEKSESFAGTKALPEFVRLTASGTGGVIDHTNREGVPRHWVFRRLQSTGWLVAVGLKTAVLDASTRNTLAYTSTAGTTLFAFAIGLTYLLGGRLEQRVGTLGIDRKPTREEFALLFDSAPNGVALVDNKGVVLLTNLRLERKFGYTQKELIGQLVEILVPERLRSAHVARRQVFARSPALRAVGGERYLLGQHKDGREFPIEVGLYPITIQAAQYTMATVIDITERTRAAKTLSDALTERDRLRRHLMRSAEDERLRLSHELHDQTGQTLIAATLSAKGLEKFLDADGRQQLAKHNSLLDQMGRTLHQVAWQLRPASIDELGLAATLDNYVSDWSDQTGIAAEFYCKTDINDLPDDVRTTIYRVIQEALTNIAKHAPESKHVSVVISRADGAFQLTVDDDGDGFDLNEKLGTPSNYGSLGIPSMRERLSLIGGTLEIESSERIGTTVFARIPIEPGDTPR
jgi:two-component system sensor histidine kinase UhpB